MAEGPNCHSSLLSGTPPFAFADFCLDRPGVSRRRLRGVFGLKTCRENSLDQGVCPKPLTMFKSFVISSLDHTSWLSHCPKPLGSLGQWDNRSLDLCDKSGIENYC